MSEEQLKAFWKAIQADAALQQKLEGVTDPDAIVTIAKEAGFCISADELKNGNESVVEVSDEELGAAAGGWMWKMEYLHQDTPPSTFGEWF